MKYLPLYESWILSGELCNNGLCHSIDDKRYLKLFTPIPEPKDRLYWAYSGDSSDIITVAKSFCPLRQNIVLFLAAMNNEL